MPTLAPVKIVLDGVDKYTPMFSKTLSKTQKFSKQMGSLGRKMSMGITAPVLLAGANVFKTAAKFEKSMNKVEALTSAPQDELLKMANLAKDIGIKTELSATMAADAMGFLGMAGWKTNQILKATPKLVDLSTATITGLAETADFTTNIMGAFSLKAENMGNIVDILAATTSSANLDLTQLAETMADAAPIADVFGASLKDTATLAGFLGNIGIQGSKAGTSIKTIFTSLAAPKPKALKWFKEFQMSTTDKDGNLKSVPTTFKKLGTALNKLPSGKRLKAITEIFGKLSLAGAAKLSQDLGKTNSQFMKLTNTMENVTGRSSKMAAIMRKGLSGSYDKLISSLEGLALAIGDSGLLEFGVKVVEWLGDFVRSLSKTNPMILKFTAFGSMLLAAIAPLLIIGAQLIPIITSVGGALAGTGGIIALLVNPITWIVAAFVGLTAAFIYFYNTTKKEGQPFLNWFRKGFDFLMMLPNLIIDNWDKIQPYFKLLWMGITKLFGAAKDSVIGDFFTFMTDRLDDLMVGIKWLFTTGLKMLGFVTGALFDEDTLKAAGFKPQDVTGNDYWTKKEETPEEQRHAYFESVKNQKQPINIKVEKAAPETTVSLINTDAESKFYDVGYNSLEEF